MTRIYDRVVLKNPKSFNPKTYKTVSVYQTSYKGKKYRTAGTKAVTGYNYYSKKREVVSLLVPKK